MRATLLAGWLTVAGATGCAVRAPSPIDVAALVARHGAADARVELTARTIADPRDVQARLALAALDDRAGLPAAAIVQLEEVQAVGGPLGVRWHADDRARLARLLHARGRARIARGAASALRDLELARQLGESIAPDELAQARAAVALADLRSVVASRRSRGRATLGALAATAIADPSWRGAQRGAAAADVGALGVWLWHAGARRAAVEDLEAWHALAAAPRAPSLQAAYLDALAWWLPFALGEVPPPAVGELVGGERCRFPGAPACSAREVIASGLDDERALAAAPLAAPTHDPDDAAAWTIVGVRAWLRDDAPLGAELAARIAPDVPIAAVPAAARPLIARLVLGRDAPIAPIDRAAATTLDDRLLIATARALAGADASELDRALGPDLAASDAGRALRARVEAAAVIASDDPRADAAVRVVAARFAPLDPAAGFPTAAALRTVAAAFRRDAGLADRLGRELIDASADGAAATAAIAALFDAVGDPGRARHAWQAAVNASAEPAFVRGLAEAEARAGDGDAALINGAIAAAESGDPAVVWIAIARALADAGRFAQTIDAAHRAIELADPAQLAAALELAIAASRAMGRLEQADVLAAQRAHLAPIVAHEVAHTATLDPTDAAAALAAYRARADAGTLARVWVASRWNPTDVAVRVALLAALPVDDSRRRAIAAELVTLAGTVEPDVGNAITQALR